MRWSRSWLRSASRSAAYYRRIEPTGFGDLCGRGLKRITRKSREAGGSGEFNP